jgi:hypothetical protein
MKMIRFLVAVAVLGSLSACMSYYQVTDTVNGTRYYTKSVKEFKSGAVAFTDAATGSRVTLQKHTVTKLERKEYADRVR